MESKIPLDSTCPHQHQHSHRRNGRGRSRRFVLCSLSLILLFTIPLCLFVFMEPPRVIVFWWAEEYDQDGRTTAPKLDNFQRQRENLFEKEKPKPETKAKANDLPKVLLISYDGFRWDYIQNNNNTPTFRWLIANGVFATEGLKNTYITITAPNHYGLVTGLYEESHGIVANEFFAPEFNETIDYFNTRTKTDPRVFGGEPVWVTNDKAGQGRSTGCQMWTGCDITIKGRIPKHFTSWDGDLSWIIRVDSVINWFKDPVDPINLGLLYIEEPDETGHQYGPDDPRTAAMVQKLDQLTAYLMWRLYSEDLLDKVNLIFTADHGMAAVPWSNAVYLDKYVNSSWYTVYGGTPNWNVLPKPGMEQKIYDALYGKVPHMSVYNKSTIPAEYHYTNTPHVLPLQFVADIHYNLAHGSAEQANGQPPVYERKSRGKTLRRELESNDAIVGEHGYNNSLTDMHPYFIGYGPAFKKGYNISQFMNLDVYPLMCHILGVDPAPNNGSFDRVRSILKNNGRPVKARIFEKTRKSNKFEDRPPWMEATERMGYEPTDYDVKVPKHYFPFFTYSINFDIFIMTLLLLVYVGIMMALSARIRRGRPDHRPLDKCCNETKTTETATTKPVNSEKCLIIDVVA